ncbi:MAG: DUF2283 domain-containing protein [Candidatus Rokubacteria bacterium]|nr:DUF2283 domain-containing protein [Candidatus Rokubacteria bacterium]
MGKIKVWYDEAGDYLEVTFADAKGHFREVAEDVFERVDERGTVLGFAVFNFKKKSLAPVEVPIDVKGLTS